MSWDGFKTTWQARGGVRIAGIGRVGGAVDLMSGSTGAGVAAEVTRVSVCWVWWPIGSTYEAGTCGLVAGKDGSGVAGGSTGAGGETQEINGRSGGTQATAAT